MSQIPEFNRGLSPASPAERYLSVPALARHERSAVGEGWEENRFPEYWSIIKRRLGIIACSTLLGGVAAVFLTRLELPVYRAHTSLEVQSINENFLNIQAVSPTSPTSGVNSEEYDIQTLMRALQSRSVLEYALSKDDLRKRTMEAEERRRVPLWRKVFGMPTLPTEPLSTDQLVAAISDAMKVQAQTNTRVVDLRVDSIDPQISADLANAITDSYTALTLQKRWDTVQSVGNWLTNQMSDLKKKLQHSEAEMQKYAQASNLLFTADTDNVAEQRLRQLQEEVVRAQADRISKQSQYELASTAPEDSLPEVLDDATLKNYLVDLTQLRQQLAELSSSFTAAYPKVVKLKAQIGALEQARDQERTNITKRIQDEFDAARRRESLLRADFIIQAQQLSAQAVKVAQYNLLKHEVDATRQLYDSLDQRVREAGLAAAMRASNVQVMDRAVVPDAPHGPNELVNTALGLFSGMLIGMFGVVLDGKVRKRGQAPGEVSMYLNISELAVIPANIKDTTWRPRLFGKLRQQSLSIADSDIVDDRVELASLRHSSAVADSFRAAIVSILGKQNGMLPKIIVISSALPNEGKTTVVSNLGIMLAQIQRRVLLIDGDLRRPRLHDIFALDNSAGFSDVLAGRRPPNIQQTKVPNLSVLPSGSSRDVDALFHSNLPNVFRRVRDLYDVVLVDTPPLLQIPDARVIAHYADAVILAVDSKSATREDVALAAYLMAQDGIPFLGTILNNYSPHKSDRGYRYSVQQYYQQTDK